MISQSIDAVPLSVEKTSHVEQPSEQVEVSSTNVQPFPASKYETVYSSLMQSSPSTTAGKLTKQIVQKKIFVLCALHFGRYPSLQPTAVYKDADASHKMRISWKIFSSTNLIEKSNCYFQRFITCK